MVDMEGLVLLPFYECRYLQVPTNCVVPRQKAPYPETHQICFSIDVRRKGQGIWLHSQDCSVSPLLRTV